MEKCLNSPWEEIPFIHQIKEPVMISPLLNTSPTTTLQEFMKGQKQKDERKELEQLIRKYTTKEPIGIPTADGYEFIVIQQIIRCEGMQKATKIIACNRDPIISPFPIGKFKKCLEPFGFFATHKSHLINLSYIKRFHKEGVITMIDAATVPLARRKKNDFLKRVHRIV